MNAKMRNLFVGGLLFNPAIAIAQVGGEPLTGNWLLRICTSYKVDEQAGCYGFVAGFVLGSEWRQRERELWCIPQDAGNDQLVDVIVRHLQRKPADRQQSADSNLGDALSTAWPCPAK